MIGFKSNLARAGRLLALFSSLVLAACAQAPIQPEPEAPAPVAAESVAPETAEPAAEAPREELTAPLLYGVLLGEIAGQRGMLDISGASYLEAARQSNDPRIAERALKISVYAKQPELALQAARRWVELAPHNIEARQTLAVLALRTEKQAEALQQFEYLLAQGDAAGTDPYQSMLVLLAREPDKQRALDVMGKLVELRPNEAQAHFAYARLAVHAQNWSLAEQEVARALTLNPGWTQALILQAQINLKQERGAVARQQLEAALAQNPDDTELRMAYARLLVDLNDFEAARREYRILIKSQPDNGQIVYSLALLSLEANQLDDARMLFEKLVSLDFQEQQAYYYLGAIAEENKKHQEAMRWYGKVDEGDHWVEVQIRMARLEAQDGDLDAARERLRRVRLAHPAETQRMFLVEGDILVGIDRHEEAYTLYSEYLDIQPDDLEILYARALVAEHLDRLDQAEADFRRVLAVDADNTRALNALGYTLADRTDRYEEALGYIERALSQAPDDPAVIDSMGWVLYRLGRLEEAREYLQRAYDMTRDSEIAAHLGEVLWVMGDRAAAKALWTSARKESPGDPVLEDTVRRYLP